MSDENIREVYRALRESQTRYAYFLLAASGAAIGLAVNQTREAALGWEHWPLGLAVLMWGLSFFSGGKHLAFVSSALYANATLLQVQGGTHPEYSQNPMMAAAANAGIRSALEKNVNTANTYARWQFRLLAAGGASYVGWHVFQMFLRANAASRLSP